MSTATAAPVRKYDCRDAYSTELEAIAAADPRIVAVVNDSVSSTKLKNFRIRFPDRFINVGIAEQNMVGVGAGLALGNLLPYVCGASCFLTARATEQVKADLGYTNSNVKLCGMSSGMAYGELGPTHHSIEDFAFTRVIPNLAVVAPADSIETRALMQYSAKHIGPMFLRMSRIPVRNIMPEDFTFVLGKAHALREGNDIAILANGVLVERALDAAELLSTLGIQSRVLNMSSVKPIDREAILDAARTTRGIVTVEEHSIHCGLGSAVAEIVAQEHPTRMRILGIPGVFAPTGSAEFLLEHFALTAAGIADAARQLLQSSPSTMAIA